MHSRVVYLLLTDYELPVDADDDLVESDNIELQIVRGMSEVSAQLRQIALRQITSSITTNLYRKPSTHDLNALQCAVEGIVTRLDRWRSIFPILGQDRSAYETIQWRDLNYFRERLKCFRPLALLSKGNASHPWMDACQEAATHVVKLYRSLWTNDKFVLNWTCVHDMMSAGFTLLYCGLAQTDAQRKVEVSDMTACVSETLSHIAEKWPSVNRHVSVFRALAGQVADSMQLDAGDTNLEAMDLTIEGAHPPENPEPLVWGPDSGHQADVWDAALVAFLDEPFDIGTIDWGTVDWGALDWDAMGVDHGEHNFGAQE